MYKGMRFKRKEKRKMVVDEGQASFVEYPGRLAKHRDFTSKIQT